jgi:hypothetical protein
MKTILNIVFILTFSVFYAHSQENTEQNKIRDKKKLELRPNSREYGAVRFDNHQKRIDRKHNNVSFLKKKATIQQKRVLLKKNKTQMKKQQLIKRRQNIIQQRRALRK